MAEVLQEPFCLQARSLHSGSISFGRFETEPLSWQRRSAFSCNNYLEEVERYSKPGSVNQRKAYFEVFFKKKGLLQPPDSLLQNWTECQAIQGELVDDSNFMDLYKESLPECDEEISNNQSEHSVKELGEPYQPQADHLPLQREDKRQAHLKPKVKAENGRSHASSKLPENHQKLGNSSSSDLLTSHRVTLEVKAEVKNASTRLRTEPSSNTKDPTHLHKEDLSMSHPTPCEESGLVTTREVSGNNKSCKKDSRDTTGKHSFNIVKHSMQNISTAKTFLSKTPKSMELRGVDKQKQHTSAKVKETGKAGSVLQTPNKRKDGSIIGQSNSRPHKVARSSTEETTKRSASTVNSNQTVKKTANKSEGKDVRIKQMPENNNSKATRTPAIHSMSVPHNSGCKMAVPVHAETAKSGRKSSDLASKAAEVKFITSTSSSIRPLALGTQLSKRSATPSKGREKISPRGEQVESKKHDSSPSQTVSKSSKLSKLQSLSTSPSPVCRDLKESSASSTVKLLSSQLLNRTESLMKNNLPTKHLPVGKDNNNNKGEKIKRDLSPSQTVYEPSKLAKLQPKSSSESSTSSSIKQLRPQGTNRTESLLKNNLPTKCLTGGKKSTSIKRGLDTSQTVTKASKLDKLQSKSTSLSPVLRYPSEPSTSSLKQLSSRSTSRTESPLKNDSPIKCLPRGKEVAAKERDSDGSQTISKRSKLEKLQPKITSPSQVHRSPTSSKSSSTEKLSSKTNRSEPFMKNNLLSKSQTRGREAAVKKHNLDILFAVTNPSKLGNLQHESTSPISVLKVVVPSSTSSSVGDFSPPPDKGIEVTSKSNEKKFPAKCPPEVEQFDAKKRPLDISHSLSKPTKLAKLQCNSSTPSPKQNMKKSETPKEKRNDTKQVGTKKLGVNPLEHESISKKSTKSQAKLSVSRSGPVGSTARINSMESLRRVESIKTAKKSDSPRKDVGKLKRAVSVSNQIDKVGKKSRNVTAVR